MKTIYHLFLVVACLAAMAATSCSKNTTENSDDGGNVTPNYPSKPEEPNNRETRKISKVTSENDGYYRSYTLDYDDKGRVTTIYCDYMYGWEEYDLNYTDDELCIFCNRDEGSYYNYFTLNNRGYITWYSFSDEVGYYTSETRTIEYNMQGYLNKYECIIHEYHDEGEEVEYCYGVTYKWSNGNIKSYEYNETDNGVSDYSERWDMTYNGKKLNVVNLDINALVAYYNYHTFMEGGIYSAIGLTGKSNKNLISKSVGESSDGDGYEIRYQWSYDEDGYPIAKGYTYDIAEGYTYDEIRCTFDFEYVD
ncbi:MAG: hypothetical protein IKC12_04465 [Alistipes sp.]|nr:hypothetical protein [Alistipes sp.]